MNNHFELRVLPTIVDVCSEAENIFTDLLHRDGKNTFIIPGGTTPQIFYRRLAQKIRNWEDTTLILSDERLVQKHTSESNSGMIKKNLLDLIREKRPPILIPVVNGFSPEQSIQILELLNKSTKSLLPPKAAFLGIGKDGHTASLFPGILKNNYNKNPFILVNRAEEQFQRISICSRILSEVPLLVFLVAGKDKKSIMNRIINPQNDLEPLIVQDLIKQSMGKVVIICDKDAAPDKTK